MWMAAYEECAQAEYTGMALEYGTVPVAEVMDALRADQWLELHPDTGTAERDAIKRRMRDAFYTDTDDWKRSIVAQALWSSVLVLTGSATALTTYTGFSITLFNGVAVAALFGWVLVCAIVVHIYAAIWIKGSVRAMTDDSGTVQAGYSFDFYGRATKLEGAQDLPAICCIARRPLRAAILLADVIHAHIEP